jgi:hypothetical protein
MKHISLTTMVIGVLGIGIIIFPLLGMYASVRAQSTDCVRPTSTQWRGCEPVISTGNVVSTTAYSAIVKSSYSSSGADYNSEYSPILTIEYGQIIPGQISDFNRVAEPSNQSKYMAKGNRTPDFVLTNLEDGEKYAYRARLEWVGGIKYGETKFFIAKKAINPAEPTTPSTVVPPSSVIPPAPANTATPPPTPEVVYSTKPTITPLGSIFGFGTSNNTTSNTNTTENVAEKSGFRLVIDNNQTEVSQGDAVTLKVRYENNTTKSADNAVVDIYLAPQYTFVSTNKGIHDRIDNKVTVSLREFPAGGYGTVTIEAKATGRGGEIDQAVSQAALRVNKIVLKVSDVDEYFADRKNSKSVLGASASQGNFLPASILGWLVLLVIVALIIILGRRYFVKKDY